MPISTEARHQVAVLAIGERAEALSFYAPLQEENGKYVNHKITDGDCLVTNIQCNNTADSVPSISAAPDASATEATELCNEIINSLHDKLNSLKPDLLDLQLYLAKIKQVHTSGQLKAFLRSKATNVTLYKHHRSVIGVQPTSIARRPTGVTRGAKRLLVGRPPNTDTIRHRTKRPRNLAYNIANLHPNAKSHGDGR